MPGSQQFRKRLPRQPVRMKLLPWAGIEHVDASGLTGKVDTSGA
jgi:hypothetical protein